jgi:hypothetical protein
MPHRQLHKEPQLPPLHQLQLLLLPLQLLQPGKFLMMLTMKSFGSMWRTTEKKLLASTMENGLLQVWRDFYVFFPFR